jgi:hypothetical protein
MKTRTWMALGCLFLPVHAFAADNQAAICHDKDFYFMVGPLSTVVGKPIFTGIWMRGGEGNKKFGLGHVVERSPNGDLVLVMSDATKEKPNPPQIIYTEGLHKAVMVTTGDDEAPPQVSVADCQIKDVPKSKL